MFQSQTFAVWRAYLYVVEQETFSLFTYWKHSRLLCILRRVVPLSLGPSSVLLAPRNSRDHFYLRFFPSFSRQARRTKRKRNCSYSVFSVISTIKSLDRETLGLKLHPYLLVKSISTPGTLTLRREFANVWRSLRVTLLCTQLEYDVVFLNENDGSNLSQHPHYAEEIK